MYKYSRKSSTKTYRPSTKKMVGLLVVGLLVVGVILALFNYRNIIEPPFFKDTSKPRSEKTSNGINYGSPTEEEKKETEAFKDDLVNNTPLSNTQQPPQTIGKKTVTPVISSWGQNSDTQAVEVAGFVAGLYENNGTCTLTLQREGESVSCSGQATANAQTVSCGYISIPRNKLSAGSWKIELKYSSSTSEGSSQQNESVEVQ